MKAFIRISLVVMVLATQIELVFADGHALDALMQAIFDSKPDQVEAVLNDSTHSVDLNSNCSLEHVRGWTPLALAAAKGDVPSVKLLLEKGAKIDQQIKLNDKLVSPLMLAAMHGHLEVIKIILNHPSFGDEGYRREMQLAQRLHQPSLLEQLRTARDSEVLAKEAQSVLESSSPPAHDTCHRNALERFPGDFMARMQDDVCLICQQIPGETGSFELLNGLKRTGDHVTAGCCHARFCSNCIQGYRQHTGRQSPRCAGCRAVQPRYVEFRNSIPTLAWRGEKIAIPAPIVSHASEITAVPGEGILASVHLLTLPAVTQADVDDLKAAGIETSITVPLRAFKISDTPVTIGLYHAVMGRYPDLSRSNWPREPAETEALRRGWEASPDLPLSNTTLEEDVAFVARLNGITGRHFRLPRESEVEYAIRGRVSGQTGKITTTGFYFGDDSAELPKRAWFRTNSGLRAHGVRETLPGRGLEDSKNSFGLIHPIGNVWIRSSEGTIRGGSFYNATDSLRSSLRHSGNPVHRHAAIGTRLVEDVDPEPAILSH